MVVNKIVMMACNIRKGRERKLKLMVTMKGKGETYDMKIVLCTNEPFSYMMFDIGTEL